MTDLNTIMLHVDDEALTDLLWQYLREHPSKLTTQTARSNEEVIAELEESNVVSVIIDTDSIDDDYDSRDRELQAENEFLKGLFAEISHDLQSPLAVAQGHLELAREADDLSHLESIEHALTRASKRLDYLGDLAHEGRLITNQEPVDLQTVVREAWRVVETTETRVEVHDTTTLVADRQRLQQLLENLFRNAVEHAGPQVVVGVGPIDDEGFYIEDDGVGIPEGEQADVFKVGYSGDAEGSGLGLAICKRIIDAHGWAITVTSSAVGGVRFEITNVEIANS